MQIGMVSVVRSGVAEIVGGNHRVSLGGVDRDQQGRLWIERIRHRPRLEDFRAARIGQQGSRTGRAVWARRQQHGGCCIRDFAGFYTDRLIVDLRYCHVAFCLSAQCDQAVFRSARIDRGTCQRRDRGLHQQRAAHRYIAAATAAGSESAEGDDRQ